MLNDLLIKRSIALRWVTYPKMGHNLTCLITNTILCKDLANIPQFLLEVCKPALANFCNTLVGAREYYFYFYSETGGGTLRGA